MVNSSTIILKRGQVKVEGTYKVEIGPITGQPEGAAARPDSAVPLQARIAEKQQDHTVIELICSCGKKSYIQCDYAAQAETQQADTPPQE